MQSVGDIFITSKQKAVKRSHKVRKVCLTKKISTVTHALLDYF